MTHRDCDGQLIEIGDRVAVQSVLYKDLKPAWVHSFTPRMVRVVFKKEDLCVPINQCRVVDPHRMAILWNQED